MSGFMSFYIMSSMLSTVYTPSKIVIENGYHIMGNVGHTLELLKYISWRIFAIFEGENELRMSHTAQNRLETC